MTTLPPVLLTKDATNLTTGLTAGETYIAQNVGGGLVEYCNFPTDPTDEDLAWRIAGTKDFFQFEADSANPTWARALTRGSARLSLGNG